MLNSNPNSSLKIVAFAVIILLLASSVLIIPYFSKSNENTSGDEKFIFLSNQNISVVAEAEVIKGDIPTIIYSQNSELVKILKKTGTAEPEILTELDENGSYHHDFALSLDRKYLAIYFNDKLRILNLETKELKDLFVPIIQVIKVSFSPDGKKLLIIDQAYDGTLNQDHYYIHLFDITTQEDSIIMQGIDSDMRHIYEAVWRADNKVILARGGSMDGDYLYLDLSNKQLIKTLRDDYDVAVGYGLISPKGKAIAVKRARIYDNCSDGYLTNVYDIIDPLTGEILRRISSLERNIEVLGFSYDEKEVLYAEEALITNRNDCDKEVEREFYKVNIFSGEITKLSNIPEDFKNIGYIDVKNEYDFNKSAWVATVNSQIAIIFEASFDEIIGKYYTK